MAIIKHIKQPIIKSVLILLGLFAVKLAFADSSGDLLQGTTQAAQATFQGSGTFYIYLGEIVAGVIGYITTRKISVFIGIIVVAFILTDIAPHFLKVAG